MTMHDTIMMLQIGGEEEDGGVAYAHEADEIFQSATAVKKESLVDGAPVVGETKRFEFAVERVPYPVHEDEPPFSGFFLGKICKSMTERNPSLLL